MISGHPSEDESDRPLLGSKSRKHSQLYLIEHYEDNKFPFVILILNSNLTCLVSFLISFNLDFSLFLCL